jgi:hypothetical protein
MLWKLTREAIVSIEPVNIALPLMAVCAMLALWLAATGGEDDV